ncbi:putative aliphatic sulfonates-binding protein SsuA [Gottschalkia purinilytica]|uniref:Putative aliphatic sulfonates-binding protein SsuA n=1 Tax=Gottschalkia purinilytica TaxID=1503 RepID=A0A0L0W7D7_GOTPU|nr:aliphatic sulfonate ABC transporter substrate-binding protein [Gottschalkia purinilytica]KNF07200.1 putative aliphatic sulfonates-binding protein SsuA [Gottschalkia purinilytica]
MKKIIGLVLLTMILVSFLVACEAKIDSTTSKKSEIKKPEVIRIARLNAEAINLVAKEKKVFEKEFEKDGIKIEYLTFDSGSPIVEGFIAGKIDISLTGDQPILTGIGKGVPISIVGAFDGGEKNQGLVVSGRSNIKNLKDLKDKKIGLGIGTVNQHLLSIYLDKAGLKKNDVKMINLKPGDSVNALATNGVDAIISIEPFVSLAEAKKVGKLLFDGTGHKRSVIILTASNDFSKKYPEITTRILKVYNDTSIWIDENKEEAAKIIATEAKVPEELLVKISSNKKPGISLSDDDIKEFNSTINFLEQSKIINKKLKVESVYNKSFFKSAGLLDK